MMVKQEVMVQMDDIEQMMRTLKLGELAKDFVQLMFQMIFKCYEQNSLIITYNLEFSGWNMVLGENRLMAALIDCLVHHSHIVIFFGESYRL